LKQRADREAIQEAVLSGNPRFFYGSDSAPHDVAKKECACGAAGVYSAPTALPLMIEFFESHDALALLPAFVGSSGAAFYALPESGTSRRFIKREWRVPEQTDGTVPLGAGDVLSWQVDRTINS
jgi:dihydroorotase